MLNDAEMPNMKPPGTTIVMLEGRYFEAEVLNSKLPSLIVFGTPWSRSCRVLDPILKRLEHDWRGALKVFKINADDALELSNFYGIQYIPTLLYFVNGKHRFQIVGTVSQEAIVAKMKDFGLATPADAPPPRALKAEAETLISGLI